MGDREDRLACFLSGDVARRTGGRGLDDFRLYLGDGERDQRSVSRPSFRRFNMDMFDSTKAAWKGEEGNVGFIESINY